ncbi:MAG: hypothetical protein L0H73_04690 [Nitrococcus sp.]|nr:hypothetical protein [Nitrococcus sp.]
MPVENVPDHIRAAAAGQWTAIGENTLASVAFQYDAVPAGYVTNLNGIMTAWSGGTYDPVRHKLYVNGGGHNDYDGSEFYAFNLATNTWSRINDPTLLDPDPSTYPTNVFPNGVPFPIHTYDTLSVNPRSGKVYRLGVGGSSINAVYEFDPSRASGSSPAPWARKATLDHPDPHSGASAWMEDEGKFLVANQDFGTWLYLRRYDPSSNAFGPPINTDVFFSGDTSMAYSPTRHLAVLHHTQASSNTWIVLNTASNTVSIRTISGAALPNRASVEYDTRRDHFVVYSDEATDRRVLYSVDPSTWSATKISPAGASINAPPGSPYNGIYGRFAYCEDYDIFIAVNSVNGRVYIYKPLDWAGSLPANTAETPDSP